MLFNFGKKRKAISAGFTGNYSIVAYGRSFGKKRLLKHRFLAIKTYFTKFLFFAAVFASVYLFFFTSTFNVKNITISGNKAIDESAIRETADAIAGKKIMGIFNNNILLVKTSEIEDAIKNKFGGVSGISVEKKFSRTLEINITEKPIDISWCNRIKIERVSESGKKSETNAPLETAQCYFSDEENIIYAKVPDGLLADSVKVFRDDLININAKAGDKALTAFVRELTINFNRKIGLTLDYLYLPPLASKEIHLVTTDGWKIYFDLNRNINDQLWVLSSVLKSKIPDSDKKNLDYIDLRVTDRVNYKTK